MSKPRKIEQLEELARTMVGDGKAPNLYFVTVEGVVTTVTRSLERAKWEWSRNVSEDRRRATSVEDRRQGSVCQHDRDEDNGGKWFTCDDSNLFRK